MGQAGLIMLDSNNVHVDESGRVFDVSSGKPQEIDTLRIGLFTKEDKLRKQGD